jgi:hypothetical protein
MCDLMNMLYNKKDITTIDLKIKKYKEIIHECLEESMIYLQL